MAKKMSSAGVKAPPRAEKTSMKISKRKASPMGDMGAMGGLGGMGMKKGGSCKGYYKGGSVDGIVKKGRTKGKMC